MRQEETSDQEAGKSIGTRTLWVWLALFTAFFLLLAILAMPYVRQYNAVQWVWAQSGRVDTEATWLSDRLPEAAKGWLSDKSWLESLERVTVVNLSDTQVIDAGSVAVWCDHGRQ